jgi:hypothetical protein
MRSPNQFQTGLIINRAPNKTGKVLQISGHGTVQLSSQDLNIILQSRGGQSSGTYQASTPSQRSQTSTHRHNHSKNNPGSEKNNDDEKDEEDEEDYDGHSKHIK